MEKRTDAFAGLSDTGRQRSSNEDVYLLKKAGKFTIAAVIDGVGGYEGGEIAAALAAEAIEAELSNLKQCNAATVRKAITRANDSIYREKQRKSQYPQMSCVLTLAVIENAANRFYYAHVGDTRLYLYRDQSLVKITHDHSFVGLLEDSGRISEAEAMSHPKRNEVDKALGFYPELPDAEKFIEAGESPFLPGDLLLLCSDGLTDLVNKEEITTTLNTRGSLKEKAGKLVALANEEGGKDNVTVVLVRHVKQQSAQIPVVPRKVPLVVEPEIDDYIEWDREEEVTAPAKQVTVHSGRRWWLWIPVALAISLLVVFGLLNRSRKDTDPVAGDTTLLSFNTLLLQDTLNKTAGVFQLSPKLFGDSIVLDDTLWIYKDSARFEGAPSTVITSKDPAAIIQVAPSISRLTMVQLQLYNTQFKMSSSAAQHIYLDNVRLRNVLVGISNPVLVEDTIYNGRLSGLMDALSKRKGNR